MSDKQNPLRDWMTEELYRLRMIETVSWDVIHRWRQLETPTELDKILHALESRLEVYQNPDQITPKHK